VPTATASASLTPPLSPSGGAVAGGGQRNWLREALAIPNPQSGAWLSLGLRFQGQGPAPVAWKLYTSALVVVAQGSLDQNWRSGWNSVRLKVPPLSQGLYFVRLEQADGFSLPVSKLWWLR
jgi:hypothetical protein